MAPPSWIASLFVNIESSIKSKPASLCIAPPMRAAELFVNVQFLIIKHYQTNIDLITK